MHATAQIIAIVCASVSALRFRMGATSAGVLVLPRSAGLQRVFPMFAQRTDPRACIRNHGKSFSCVKRVSGVGGIERARMLSPALNRWLPFAIFG